MASGIEMLMKSMGIDPDEIKRNVDTLISTFKNGLTELNERQKETNVRLARLESAMNIPLPDVAADATEQPKRITNGTGNLAP